MFLKVEGSEAINLELIDKIQFNEKEERATCFAGGIVLHADSKVLYKFFQSADGQALFEEFTYAPKAQKPVA